MTHFKCSRRCVPNALVTALLSASVVFATVACKEGEPRGEPKVGMLLTDSEADPAPASSVAPATFPASVTSAAAATPEESRAGSVPNSATCLLVPAAQLRRVEPGHYMIERAALVGALDEMSRFPERWFNDSALSWEGQPKALRVNGIEDADACGIQNGDRVVNIQGIAAGDPLLPKKLRAELAMASELHLVVARDGKYENLRYDVVERLAN